MDLVAPVRGREARLRSAQLVCLQMARKGVDAEMRVAERCVEELFR